MATGAKGKGTGKDGGKTAAPPRQRRKVLPSLTSSDVSGLDESAQERIAPSERTLAASAAASSRPARTASSEPSSHATNKDPSPMTTPETTPKHEVRAPEDLAPKVAAAKSLAGSAMGVGVVAAVVAALALVFGPFGDERQLLRQDVSQLRARIVQQERESRALALSLAVEQTRMAILRSSASFEPAVAGIAAVVGGDAEAQRLVAALRPLAKSGVPTMRQLNVEFGFVAGAALVVSALPAETSWVSQTLARFTGWTAQIGSQLPIEAYSPVTRQALEKAYAALQRDDLKGALDALKGVDAGAMVTLQPWIASAERRAAAEDALSRLSELAAGRLAASRA